MKTIWLSFARPGESYVVITDAPTTDLAIVKALKLKNFKPGDWSLETYEVDPNGEEVKELGKDRLITREELRSKMYPSSRKNRGTRRN